MLQSMESQRVRRDLAAELQQDVLASFPCSTVLDILASTASRSHPNFIFFYFIFVIFFLKDFFGLEACGILIPKPGIEPAAPALEGKTSREAPKSEFYKLPSVCVIDCFLCPHCRRPLKHLFLFPVSALYTFCPLFLHMLLMSFCFKSFSLRLLSLFTGPHLEITSSCFMAQIKFYLLCKPFPGWAPIYLLAGRTKLPEHPEETSPVTFIIP